MGHHQHGHALLRQLPHDGKHLVGELRIQRGGGLVEEDDLRPGGKRPGNGHPLLLAAGELAGIIAAPVRHAHLGEHLHPQLLRLGLWDLPDHDQAFRHILQGGLVEKKIIVLKDKGGLLPELGDLPLGGAIHLQRLPVEDHGPPVGPLQKVDAPQQRGLAGAAWPQNGNDIPLLHGKAHALEDLGPAKGFVDITELQHHASSCF